MGNFTQPLWEQIRCICFRKINLIFYLLLLVSTLSAQTRTYTSNGTYLVPAGVTTVQVQAWGGGGAGGGVDGSNSQTRAGGGGAGGSFTQNNSVAVTPGATINVTVGAGGIGASAADGGSGGTSTFGSVIPVSAVGGAGGIEGDGSPQYGGGATTTVGVTRNGGAGSAASGGNSGAGGGGAGSSGNGGNASGTTAGSGGSGGGGNGAAGRNSNGDGNDASALAGGGGGGRSSSNTNRSGGDGFRGQVIVTWTCPTYSLNANPTANSFCSTEGTTNQITLSGTTSNLPVGTYTVTYNRSSPSGTGLTASMTVTTAGTGTFTATGLTNTGNCTITITNLSSGNDSPVCSSNILTNNSVTFVRSASATVVAGNTFSTCGDGAVNVTSGASASNYSTLEWTSSGTGSFTNSNSLTSGEYTPSSTDLSNGFATITLTATSGSGFCGSAVSSKTIYFIQTPNTTSATICQGSSGNLSSAVLTGGLVSLSGTWGTSLNAVRPDTGSSSTCDFSYNGGPQTRNYHAIKFRVSTSGSYTFTMSQNNAYDGMGYIYSGNFIPGSCGSGSHIRRDDDSGPDDEPQLTMTLNSSTVYTLISTTYGNTGTYIGSFTWSITPPSGGLVLPVTEWYTTATGGNPIAFGNSFNPVGTAGSGLSDTNTPGTNTYYAANSLNENCPRVATTFEILENQNYYTDSDGDGFGGTLVVSCNGQPMGTVLNNLDSNDNLVTYSDQDGDGFGSTTMAPSGVTNSLDCNDNQLQYVDVDGDGFGSNIVAACGVLNNSDCDDNDVLKHTTFSFYVDADNDGYGSGSLVNGICAIDANTPPNGYALNSTDCDDNNSIIYQTGDFYSDADGDNYAVNATTTNLCYGATEPNGYSLINLGIDCDDTIAAVNPGMPEILYDGYDNNCNGQLDEGNQILVSMSGCGTTLNAISSLISCVSTPGIDGYRFQITDLVSSQVQTIDRPHQYFSLTQLSNYDYARTYSVRVMARKNGVWLNYYGNPCLFSTPPITSPTGGVGSLQLQSYCGETLPSISSIIATTSLPGATGYRYRVTNDLTGEVQTIDRTLHWFSLTMLNSFHYGTTYSVDVAVKTTEPNFPANPQYGAACTVSTPSIPGLSVHCDQVIPTKGVLIPTLSLNRVTLYRFEVTRYTDNTASVVQDVSIVDKMFNRFTLNDITNYSPNTTYGVRVTMMTSGTFPQSSIPGQLVWGDACLITSPAALRTSLDDSVVSDIFNVIGYPNPFTYEFTLQANMSSDNNITIKVYDMIGKLIDGKETSLDKLANETLGENYPSGVYNVVVTQGHQTQSIKMIKR